MQIMAKMSLLKKWSVRTFVKTKLVLNRVIDGDENETPYIIALDYLSRGYSTSKMVLFALLVYFELALLVVFLATIGFIISTIFW